MRIKLLGSKDYIHPLDSSIDFPKWEKEKREGYFKTNYELPPIKDGETPAIFTLKQLSPNQLNRLMQIELQIRESYIKESGYTPTTQAFMFNELWISFLIRCSIEKWTGLEIENNNGSIDVLKPEFEDTGIYGKMLTNDSYNSLLPFFLESLGMIAYSIHCLSIKS